jgi:Na+/melibiose symporter-like transporter
VCIVGTGKLSSFATPAQKRGLAVASGVFMLAGLGVYVVATSVAALGAAVVLVNVGVGVNTPMNAILVGDMFDRCEIRERKEDDVHWCLDGCRRRRFSAVLSSRLCRRTLCGTNARFF